ncbi:electron transport complex subunit RsxC [Aurantivibrio plasticivorans]
MRQIWPTPGGVHPPENKTQSLGLPIAQCPLPPQVILPVSQHLGAPADPIVSVGDKVLKGQLVAEAPQQVSANIHASTSGTVVAIEERPLPHPSGLSGLSIVIEADGKDEWCELQPIEDYSRSGPTELIQKIQAAGVVGMGGAGFPAAVKLASRTPITTLIINGTECEPYITSDDILMRTYAEELVEAIRLLDYLLNGPQEVLIAIESNKPEAIEKMTAAIATLNDPRYEVVTLPAKYPNGGEKQLVQMLTGKEVPSGKIPAALGVVCQNVATALAAYRAVTKGEPLISRITTITGNAFSEQRNLEVLVGTPISFILQQQGYSKDTASRLVMGGPMMGFTLLSEECPVIKTTNCLLAPTQEEAPANGPEQACIRCGMCAEACPASLLPQQLYWYSRAQDEDKLKAYNLFDCIECGACSYVCPSQIPLVQYYRAAKGEIRQHEIEKKHSEKARERFEFHKERIEAEKAARAKAREEAAAKAKLRAEEKKKAEEAKLAQANSQATDSDTTPSEAEAKKNLVADIIAGAKKAQDDPARLARNITSTEDRLKKLQAKVEELEQSAPDQAEAIRARIKETEVKLKSLQDKQATLGNSEEKQVDATLQAESNSQSDITLQAEKAVEKMEMSANQKVQRELDTLKRKLAKITEQLASTDEADSDTRSALELSEKMLKEKLRKAEAAANSPASSKADAKRTLSGDEQSAVGDAITRSMERAMQKQSVDVEELRQKIQTLEARIEATQERIAATDDATTKDALRKGLVSMQTKLEKTQALYDMAEQSSE